jgi:hypothetical protein
MAQNINEIDCFMKNNRLDKTIRSGLFLPYRRTKQRPNIRPPSSLEKEQLNDSLYENSYFGSFGCLDSTCRGERDDNDLAEPHSAHDELEPFLNLCR